jgi:tRNA (guanine6-N2)-methyltransferase
MPARDPALPGHRLHGHVEDVLLLETLPGVVDVLVEELRQLDGARTTILRRWPSAVLMEYSGPIGTLAGIPLFSACSVWTGVEVTADDVATPVAEVVRRVAGESAYRPESGDHAVPFRVGEVGEARWAIRDALLAHGLVNSPGSWDLNVDVFDRVLVVTIGALHTTRRAGALERIPASTNPVLAAALARLAKVKAGDVVLDPFCGAGTNLLAAAGRGGAMTLIGLDLKLRAVEACRANLEARSVRATIAQSTAVRLPLADLSVDRVVSNLPFGKRVGTHGINERLYPAVLRELARVLRSSGRAVLLTEDKRLFVDSVQRTHGLKIVRESVFETGGLHPSAYVVERSRKVRPRARLTGSMPAAASPPRGG